MRWVDFPVQFESEMIRRLEQVITTLLYDLGFLYGTFLMLDPWFAVFFLSYQLAPFFLFSGESY